MSGPKYVEPDRSATYNYTLDSAEAAAGVLAQLSAFGAGVMVSVRNNRITIDVSDSAWHAGMTASEIKSRVDAAKQRYEHELLEKRKRNAVAAAERVKSGIRGDAEQKRKTLESARAKCGALAGRAAVKATTAFGAYDMADALATVNATTAALGKKLSAVAGEESSCRAACDRYIADIKACGSLARLSALVEPSMRITPSYDGAAVAELEREITAKRVKFDGFVGFLGKVDGLIKSGGLEEYRARITEKVRAADMYSPNATEEISALVSQIEKEHAYLLEKQRADKISADIAKSGETKLAALNGIRELLKAYETAAATGGDAAVDYAALNAKLADDCGKLVEKLSSAEFLSAESKQRLARAAETLKAANARLRAAETHAKLNALAAELGRLQEKCTADSALFAEFKEQYARYEQLYAQLDGVFAASDKREGGMQDPASVMFDYFGAQAQIKELKERNVALAITIGEYRKQTTFRAIEKAVGGGKCGTTFKKEKSADGSLHLAFARRDSKGAIYDACCAPDGGITVSPRGVILSNGKAAISPENLRALHDKCGWADDFASAFAELGMPDCGWTECDSAAREALYDKSNYYVIKSARESVEYLRLAGFTDDEIAAFGYDAGSTGGTREARDMYDTGEAQALERKPGDR